MPERERYIPGVPCWVDCQEPDPSAATDFYADIFGWEVENVMPADAGGEYWMGRIRGGDAAAIGSIPPGAPPRGAWNTYVAVASADDAAQSIRDAGGTVFMDAFDVMDAGRMAVAADPQGAMFAVWEAKANIGAKVVNEHGALNFNGLTSGDLAAAEQFYGAVFGWKLLSIDAGPFWILPGYGDHLEESTPGLKESMAQMGAPDGFVDVVAIVNPVGGEQTGDGAHWTVTFGVDDVRATVARAAELGGTVVQDPTDAPWTRVAVIEDPQGARFIAGQFVAENAGLTA